MQPGGVGSELQRRAAASPQRAPAVHVRQPVSARMMCTCARACGACAFLPARPPAPTRPHLRHSKHAHTRSCVSVSLCACVRAGGLAAKKLIVRTHAHWARDAHWLAGGQTTTPAPAALFLRHDATASACMTNTCTRAPRRSSSSCHSSGARSQRWAASWRPSFQRHTAEIKLTRCMQQA